MHVCVCMHVLVRVHVHVCVCYFHAYPGQAIFGATVIFCFGSFQQPCALACARWFFVVH